MKSGRTIGDRIKEIRGKLSRKEFSENISVHAVTVRRWEEGQTSPDSEAIVQICSAFNINSNWLLYEEGPMRRPVERDIGLVNQILDEDIRRKPPEIPQRDDIDYEQFDFVPMAEAHLSAGGGAFVLSESFSEFYAFRKDWLRSVVSAVRNAVLMKVRGGSMEPTLHDGDVVMIDTGRILVYDDYLYAIGRDDLIFVKRLVRTSDGKVRVISDNPDIQPELVHLRDMRIIGQVIWFARELLK